MSLFRVCLSSYNIKITPHFSQLKELSFWVLKFFNGFDLIIFKPKQASLIYSNMYMQF